MTTQQLDGINENPDAACESCGSPDDKTPLFVDHLSGPICLKCMALKFAQVSELQKFDEQTKYSEKEHFVAEYMHDRGFKMLNDDGTVYGCTLRHIITMLTNYSAPHFTTDEDLDKVPGAQVVDATWLAQLRGELEVAELDAHNFHELHTSMADTLGQDPKTWPTHGNKSLAMAAAVALMKQECDALARVTGERDRLTTMLRDIIKAARVDQVGANIETAGPDMIALGNDVITRLNEPQVFPMETAPTDGTRVLILNRQHGYDSKLYRYVPHGESWVECYFVNGKWEEWCGSFKITSSANIDPIEWAHVPGTILGVNTFPVADAWAQPANFGHDPLTQLCIADAAQLGKRNKIKRIAGWAPNEGGRPAQPGTLVDILFEDGARLYGVDIVKVTWRHLDKPAMNVTHWRLTRRVAEGNDDAKL